MTNKAATETQLSELHSLLTKQFKNILEGKKPIPAATLAVIVKFLKDNNIEALAEHSDELKGLASRLPNLPDLEEYMPENFSTSN